MEDRPLDCFKQKGGKTDIMFLHLGEKTIVNTRDIIGIFDIENTSVSKDTREFLRGNGQYRVVTVSYEMPKSFVICSTDGEDVVYISQISAATLKKRLTSRKI